MKKLLLVASLLITLAAKSQIVNNGFETWGNDTFVLDSGKLIASWPADTIVYLDPAGWTTSNTISDLDSFSNILLVTPDSTPQSGSLDIKMRTSVIKLPITLFKSYAGLASDSIVLPGFAVNGRFPLTATSLTSSGLGNLNPGDIAGAGQEFHQRLASISGYYKYNPVFDSITQRNDSCLVYAVLRGTTNNKIATAIFKSNVTTSGWQHFSANFTYANCDIPDTLVILIASSIPNAVKILQGVSDLTPGSQFYVDSIYYDTLPNSYVFPVWTKNDFDTVLTNSSNNAIHVTLNDVSCNDTPLVATLVSGPFHGTATVSGGDILYTPNNNYSWRDTITYASHNTGGDSATAKVYISVRNPSALMQIGDLPLHIYPVPTSSELNVNFENPGRMIARVYDILGNVVTTATLTGNYNKLNVQQLNSGMYIIELVDAEGAVAGRGKFTITK